ncbi:chemotaxis protein CheB [Rhodococcoides trifolii]|uniref:protein-glutamate methylesterase n=1 Tax=Rhodococcoides trifolii TaxID=908250 RepID=A0A917G7F4_9NOCA|nr:chemotaxis protein CheB [Rhodococcus trifolii]GGG25603.1 chemotaxis protein CheB [Rhodococcus trifolii]
MADFRSPGVVAVGASAGGVQALTEFVAHLPADFPYAVLVVLHMPDNGTSALSHILHRSGPLPAYSAVDGAPLRAGTVCTAEPGHHLLEGDGIVVVGTGPTESSHRPSINALFRSVALHSGPRGVAVLLSGVGDDGVDGLTAVQARGGVTIAQQARDALYPSLPNHAVETVGVDLVLTVAEMGPVLAAMGDRDRPDAVVAPADDRLVRENHIATGRIDADIEGDRIGRPSGYVCPDCGGALLQVGDDHRYRCRIGHAWTGAALLDAYDADVDRALSVALRSLHDRAHLAAAMALTGKPEHLQNRYRRTAREARRAADVLRSALR